MKLFAEIVPDKASLKKMKREVEGVKPKVGAKTPATPAPAPATPAPAVPSGDMGMGALIMPMMKMLAPLMIIAAGIGMLIKVLMDLEPIKAIMEMINNILKIALLPVAMMLMRYLMPVLIWLMKAMRQGFWKTLFGVGDKDEGKTILGVPKGKTIQERKREAALEGGPTLADHLREIDWAGFWNWLTGGDEPNLFGRFWNWLVGDEETESVWSRFTTWLSNAWNEFIEDLKTRLKGFPSMVWNNFTNAISRGASALRGLGSWILSWARRQIRRARKGAGELVGRVGKAIGVTDFVVTPAGILKTHPNDYLIGTKNPDALGGGSGTTINIKVDGVATDEIVRQMERKLARVVRNMDVI